MKPNTYHTMEEIQAPPDQKNARLCDRFYDGSKYMIAIKSGGKIRIVSLRYFIKELTTGIPPEEYR